MRSLRYPWLSPPSSGAPRGIFRREEVDGGVDHPAGSVPLLALTKHFTRRLPRYWPLHMGRYPPWHPFPEDPRLGCLCLWWNSTRLLRSMSMRLSPETTAGHHWCRSSSCNSEESLHCPCPHINVDNRNPRVGDSQPLEETSPALK